MAMCLMEHGYRATTVADVVRVARTSRRSFYQEFSDK
ncbi:helix-turn-helix transcriptional regulator, partial [Streptomyces sp. SID10244]|nr:helix-turn-helix transcriptional regulator [Streptomyces sp. SID10244]